MTAQEAQKRSEKAQGLKVWQVDDTWFYVESEDGKIAYKCCIPMMSEAQKSAIYNLSRRRGISVEELENMAQQTFTMPVESLSHENAVTFIRTLQQAA